MGLCRITLYQIRVIGINHPHIRFKRQACLLCELSHNFADFWLKVIARSGNDECASALSLGIKGATSSVERVIRIPQRATKQEVEPFWPFLWPL